MAYGFAFLDADPDRAREAMLSGRGDRSRQRQPHLRDLPGVQSGWNRSPTRRSAGRARLLPRDDPPPPRLRQHAPRSVPSWLPSPPFSTGSDATKPPRPWPDSPTFPHAVSRAGDQHRDNPPARSSRRPNLRILSPQGRTDDHRRDGDLRTRPNRPGPSRTERRLEIDHIRDTQTAATGPGIGAGQHDSKVCLRSRRSRHLPACRTPWESDRFA